MTDSSTNLNFQPLEENENRGYESLVNWDQKRTQYIAFFALVLILSGFFTLILHLLFVGDLDKNIARGEIVTVCNFFWRQPTGLQVT